MQTDQHIQCLAPYCDSCFKNHVGLKCHWKAIHEISLGDFELFRLKHDHRKPQQSAQPDEEESDSVVEADITQMDEHLLSVAMDRIDSMKYRFFQRDSEVQRAKTMVKDLLAAAKPAIIDAVKPHVSEGLDLERILNPILDVMDKINSTKLETKYRRQLEERNGLPQLKVYPRNLGKRPQLSHAVTSRAVLRKGSRHADDAVVWETKLEEVLERELAYDPDLLNDIVEADMAWTKATRERKEAHDLSRKIADVSDGQVWAEHPFLGDPNYKGPVRLAFSGYCDDVDIPNPVGPSAGDHKLFLSYLVLLNRNPSDRLTLASVNLASVCLASDTKLVTPEILISGPEDEPYDSTSIGANFRRFDAGVTLKTPKLCGVQQIHVRGWLVAWSADGMAMGAVCGTNSSFSKALNICNLCEDGWQGKKDVNHKPCGFLCCRCPPDEDGHNLGCKCHFKLRTPVRDAKRQSKGSSSEEFQKLGITTEQHGFVRVPYVDVCRIGPKDIMHVFFEGVTRHFSAHTLFMLHHAGWATISQIQHALVTFKYGNGLSGFDRPGYVPPSIYTRTKVTLNNGKNIWGPHKHAKLPYSAYGMMVYTVHSLEVLRPFLPQDALDYPWWAAWVEHVRVINQLLKFEYTVEELMKLEESIIRWQTLFFSVPEFYNCWIPKHHWALHAAHDIWRWGPPRFLWCMIYEMKNAHFKRGCKRSNFHNPVKATAIYYVDYSAHALKRRRRKGGGCNSLDSSVIQTCECASTPMLNEAIWS